MSLFIFPNTLYLFNTSYKPFLILSFLFFKLLSFQILFMALIYLDDILFNYTTFTMIFEGVSYPVDQVPREIIRQLTYDQEYEMWFLLMNSAIKEERQAAARAREVEEREQERLRLLEEQERIIGLAVTMSRIFSRCAAASQKKENPEDPLVLRLVRASVYIFF